MRRYVFIYLILLGCVLPLMAAHSVADIPNVHTADRNRYVSNPDGVLSDAAVRSMDEMIGPLWDATSSEFVVVAVDDIDTDDIDGFATKLYEKWGIGKSDNDNGMLMLIVRDKRRAVLRTGYGLEGVMPDIVCGRIIRDDMAPHYRNGDYDAGTLKAVARVCEMISNPDAAAEVKSKYENDVLKRDGVDGFKIYLDICAVVAVAYLLLVLLSVFKTRKEDEFDRYNKLDRLKAPGLFLSFAGLGMPLPAFLLLLLVMRRIRNKKRKCPNCHHAMVKLDEKHDNDYLTPAQDLEERLNSIDYDVWLCPQCHEKDVIPFINKASSYTVCPACGARACTLVGDRRIVNPTESHAGKGVKIYRCRNCGNQINKPYNIPKLPTPVIVPIIGGGGGGGGGFSGGSFGGGMTGGGGASGGW